MRRLAPIAIVAASWLIGCSDESIEQRSYSPTDDHATLALVQRGDRVTLRYTRTGEAPRVAEIWLDHPGVEVLGAEAGAAVEAAEKRLILQSKGAATRLVILSTTNTATLDSGPLAELTVRGTGAVAIRRDTQIFAPAAANRGLRVGDPIVLGE